MDGVTGVDGAVTQTRQKHALNTLIVGGRKVYFDPTWKSGAQLTPWPRASAVYDFSLF